MSEAGGDIEFGWFIGIDWGTVNHVVSVGAADGTILEELTVPHTSAELERFAAHLTTLTGGQWARIAVGIEVPRGAVVELLLERGAAVFALNPKQLDRFRDRFSVAGAKDDRLDARVLSSALRTDRARFRRVAVDDPLVLQLREWTRADAVLAEDLGALTRRLRELVHRIAPQWLTLSANADDPWFWGLLDVAATPTLGQRLRRAKVQSLLRRYRVRRVTPDAVLAALHTPPLQVAPGTVEAVVSHIQLLLPRLRLVAEQRRACTAALEAVLATLAESPVAGGHDDPPVSGGTGTRPQPSDVAIMRSAPGVGPIVSAILLADAGPLVATRSYEGLRAVAGVAPVRQQTGKQRRGTVSMRRACNVRLRNACYHWARNSIRLDAGAKAYYAALRARGHSSARALRSVADRWLRILIAMLNGGTLYDPSRFHPSSPTLAKAN
jgi:transposase